MKALSIIGIVFSIIAAIISIAVTQISCYCYSSSYSSSSDQGLVPGLFLLFISLFFLAFSIVATISSFRRKKG